MSLAVASLHESSRNRDAGRGNTGTNRPVRESHASRNKTVGDLFVDAVMDAASDVGDQSTAAAVIVPQSTSQ